MFKIQLESILVFIISLGLLGVLFYYIKSDLQIKRIVAEKYLQCETNSGTLYTTED